MASLLSYALCAVSDVRDTPGFPAVSAISDNYIIRKINQATEMIESYCDRRFASTVYTDEPHDGSLTDQLTLQQYPISNVTLKARSSVLNQASTNTIDTDLYFINSEAGTIGAVRTFYGHFDRWLVSYTGGYATIPSDLSEACATLAAYLCLNALTPWQLAKRKQEGGREIEYLPGNSNLVGVIQQIGIDSILDPYAKVNISGNR